jgi:hypothetical protein
VSLQQRSRDEKRKQGHAGFDACDYLISRSLQRKEEEDFLILIFWPPAAVDKIKSEWKQRKRKLSLILVR